MCVPRNGTEGSRRGGGHGATPPAAARTRMRAQAGRLRLPASAAPGTAPLWPADLAFEWEPPPQRQRRCARHACGALRPAATSAGDAPARAGRRVRRRLRAPPQRPLASLGPQLQAGARQALLMLPMNVRRFLAGAFAGAGLLPVCAAQPCGGALATFPSLCGRRHAGGAGEQ